MVLSEDITTPQIMDPLQQADPSAIAASETQPSAEEGASEAVNPDPTEIKKSVPYHVRWEQRGAKLSQGYERKLEEYNQRMEEKFNKWQQSLDEKLNPILNPQKKDPVEEELFTHYFGNDPKAQMMREKFFQREQQDPRKLYSEIKRIEAEEKQKEEQQLNQTRQRVQSHLETLKESHGDFNQNEFLKWVDDQSAIFGAQINIDNLPKMFEFWSKQQGDPAAQKKELGGKTTPGAAPAPASSAHKVLSGSWGSWRDKL